MSTSQSHGRRRPIVVALTLMWAHFFSALPQVHASLPVQPWVEDSAPSVSNPTSPLSLINSRRSAASVAVHDKFFVPAMATIGVVLLVALLCCFSLVREPSSPTIPPIMGEVQPQPDRPPLPYLRSQAGSVSATESVSTRSKRQSRIQRKPPPAFRPSPSQTPPGTATRPDFNSNNTNLPVFPTPGVPQHPSLAMYNPEPLPFAPSAPMNVTRTAPGPGPSDKRFLSQEGPRMSTLSAGSAGQSSTQIGSGASENALSYISYVSRNGHQNHAQNQGSGEATVFAVPSQNPPSPPAPLPPVRRHSNRYSHRQEKIGSLYQSTHRSGGSRSSVAVSEWESKPAETTPSGLPPSSPLPQYSEVKGFAGSASSLSEKAPLKRG